MMEEGGCERVGQKEVRDQTGVGGGRRWNDGRVSGLLSTGAQHALEPRDDHWRPAVMLRLNPHVAGLDDVGLQSRFSQVAIKLLTWYNQSIQCAWPD